jgi:hypothetical protein
VSIPFVKAKTPPTPEEEAARLKEKNERKGARQAAAAEERLKKFQRTVGKKQAKWESTATLRAAKNEFKAKYPDMISPLGHARAAMGKVGSGLDGLSAATFVRMADRGLLIALIAAIIVAFGLDVFFFATKASEVYLGPLFILLAISARLIAICAGVMLEALKGHKGIDKRALATWRFIWFVSVFVCFMSEVSFFVAKSDKVDVQQSGIESVASTSTGSVDDQVAELKKQQADIRADRDKNIATLQQSIDNITKDGLDNDSDADPYRADQNAERESARDRIAAIDASITLLIASKGTTRTDAAKAQAEVSTEATSSWAVFSWFSDRTGTAQRDVVDIGMLTIAMFLMLVVAFGPGAYFSIRRLLKDFARKLVATEAEEAAALDAEVAEIEKRIEVSRAAAAAARTQQPNDDEVVLQQAKSIQADAERELAIAQAEVRAKEIRAEIERLKNPPPLPPPPGLTPQQQAALNASRAAAIAAAARGAPEPGVPVGAWSGRPDRVLNGGTP